MLQKGTDMQIKPLTLTQKKVKLSKDEYETRKLLYGPDTPDFEKIPDHQVFLLCKKKEVTLSQGFLPIKFFIYDIMRLKMQKQYDKLTSEGATVYGMNTDSLFINSNYQYPKENINKDTFSSIGKIRYDIGKTCHYKMFELKDNYDEIKLAYVPVQKVIQIKDEWDKAEFKEIFDNNTGVIVKAEIPGAGKTSCFKNYAQMIGKEKVLFVTPWNNLCADLLNDGFDACTLCSLLGVRVNEKHDEVETKVAMNIENFEVIVFDEIFCHPVKNLARIKEFMSVNYKKRFFATGDPDQNPPIEQNLTVANKKEYYGDIISMLFPNVITLKISKRLKNPTEGDTLRKIKEEIFKSKKFDPVAISKKYFKCITDPKDAAGCCITYRNISGEILNKKKHEEREVPKKFVEYKGIKYYSGVELRCRKYYKSKSEKLFVNFVYVIEEIDKKEIKLNDRTTGKIFTLPINVLDNFSLNYAQTCHSLQGITVQDAITIFNVNYMFVTEEWFWTAITRCTSIDSIYVYISEKAKDEKEIIKHSILKKIAGHKVEDKKKGRPFEEEDFVQYNDVVRLFKSQDGKCALCGTELNIEFRSKNGLQFSINRIDNKLAHVKDNCELVCLLCQHSYH
jgi:hypothetical protein